MVARACHALALLVGQGAGVCEVAANMSRGDDDSRGAGRNGVAPDRPTAPAKDWGFVDCSATAEGYGVMEKALERIATCEHKQRVVLATGPLIEQCEVCKWARIGDGPWAPVVNAARQAEKKA